MNRFCDSEKVKRAFLSLQVEICDHLFEVDDECKEICDEWTREEGGGGISRAFSAGHTLEKGGVNFSDVRGKELPPSASLARPELNGLPFRAMGVSVVIHPDNPYVPTSHANVRYFEAGSPDNPSAWWFGGGFDLTPYYPFWEDVVDWHQAARSACSPFGEELYPRFKKACDEYFYLPHRNETRGIGGIFFDDFNLGGFNHSLDLVTAVGKTYRESYFEIFRRRKNLSFGQREKEFQKYRRGRYAEFNLVYDRGTLFGLQSAGRTESILMSMPPEVSWSYGWIPDPGSPEEELYNSYLRPRNWLDETA